MCDAENQQQTLAIAPGLGSITLCACGTISLHVGGVSVRMAASAFAQPEQMCAQPSPRSSSRPTHFNPSSKRNTAC
jgi:hypothetical protein